MNSNETLRNLTTVHAQMLSGILKNISETFPTKNFDMFYMENPLELAIQQWESQVRH